MIRGKYLEHRDDLTEVLKIWREVFINEKRWLDIEAFEEDISSSIYAAVYMEGIDNSPVAVGRLVYDGDICRLDKIAVLEPFRGYKYGDFLVRMLLNKAFTTGIDRVTLETDVEAENFFRKIGFQRTEEHFTQTGLVLYKMSISCHEVIKMCRR